MKKRTVAVILFFAVLFAAGLAVTGTYGMPYDEKQEQAILNANTREYMLRHGLGDRIPAYTEQDESEYRISTSIQKDHGIAAYYPIAWYILNRDSRPTAEVSLVWQTYTYCVNFLGVLACYGLVECLTKKRLPAAAAALVLFGCPRMFAEMHYNNKDMVCLTLMLITLYFGTRWILEGRRRFAVGFGIAAAFSTNARLIAAFAFGVVGLTYLILLYSKHRRAVTPQEKGAVRVGFADGFIAIGVCALTYIAITPALWAGPVAFARYLVGSTINFSRWNDPVLYAGAVYQRSAGTPLPRTYLPVMIALTTPIWALALIVWGTVLAWARGIKTRFAAERDAAACMVASAWIVPVLLAVALRTHIYNGWRQFYFVFGPMAVMAGLAVDSGLTLLKKKPAAQKTFAAALAGCMLFTGYGVVKNHPYQFGYVNALAGKNASADYELDYWHVSAGPLIKGLMEEVDGARTVTLSAFTAQDVHALYYAKRQLGEEQKARVTVAEKDLSADYILINSCYRYRIPEETLEAVERDFHVYSTAVSYGNVLMTLYERNAE